mmetsp:Transcript_38265/g.74149  ORF Transcript_38265/g.74149 Transcript_38265/m.74149 type:complete len:532 (-) Transcript_38265:173-1768(-)
MANADTSNIEDAVIRATHEILTRPDLSANIGICDWLRRRPRSIPTAVRVIKQRLKHRQLSVQTMALELLATLMIDCRDIRHHIAHPEFLKQYLNMLPKKIKEPNARFVLKTNWTVEEGHHFERMLELLKTWAREYGNSTGCRAFRQAYDQLKSTGCKFPSVSSTPAPTGRAPERKRPSDRKNRRSAPPMATPSKDDARPFTDRECRTAMEAYVVLEQMLTASEPSENLKRNDIIQSLLAQVVAGQKSISRRVASTGDPAVLDDLLRANDKLVWVIKYYQGLLNGTMQRIKKEKPRSKPVGMPGQEMGGKKSKKKSKKKQKDLPTEEEVAKLRKEWKKLQKAWRKDKSDKALRKEMRAAKRAYEEKRDMLEDEDEDEDEGVAETPETNNVEKKEPKKKAATAAPVLFNLAPPPDGGFGFAPPPAVSTGPAPAPAPAPVEAAVLFEAAPAPAPAPAPAEDLSDPFAALAMRKTAPAPAPAPAASQPAPRPAGGIDLMDLFDGGPAPQAEHKAPPQQPAQQQQGGEIDLAGIFG